jgi:hypothetical protein
MIRRTTALIAPIGSPTHAFKAPMIQNPYCEHAGIDAVVVPMGCRLVQRGAPRGQWPTGGRGGDEERDDGLPARRASDVAAAFR